MHQTQGIFQGADNLPLFYQSWQPEGEPRAVVVIAHGFGEATATWSRTMSVYIDRDSQPAIFLLLF